MTQDIAGLIGAVTREVTGREHTVARPAWCARAGPMTRRWRTSGTRSPTPSAFRAGSCRSPAIFASAAAISFRAMRAARSPAAIRPAHLALTWEFGGEVSWVKVDLSEAPDGGTHLALEHVAHVDDARWNQFGPGAVGVGWDMTLMGLDRHLAGGAAVDPQEAMAWLGRRTARTSFGAVPMIGVAHRLPPARMERRPRPLPSGPRRPIRARAIR